MMSAASTQNKRVRDIIFLYHILFCALRVVSQWPDYETTSALFYLPPQISLQEEETRMHSHTLIPESEPYKLILNALTNTIL